MQPRRILIIAPSSFPVQHAEAIVNVKLIKVLASSGKFIIDLISQNNPDYINYPSDGLDSYNLNVESIKILDKENEKGYYKKFRFLAKTMFTTGHIWRLSKWAFNAFKYGEELCSVKKYDYILTKDQDSFLVGALLRDKYNIPLVATWNDPFPECHYPYPYTPKHNIFKKIESKIIEKIIRKYVDINIFPNLRLRDYMIGRLSLENKKTIIIPHVVNGENVRNLNQVKNELKIICAGNNKYPRDPFNIIKAIKKLSFENPDINAKLTFLGPIDDKIRNFIYKNNLGNRIGILGSVSYKKSLDLIREFDVAVVLEANCKEGIFLPTKVGDYLQLGIKIMAVSPVVGVLNDLYKTHNIDYFCNVNSIEDIKNEIIRAWNERDINPSHKIPNDYKEKPITDKYYNLFLK